MFPRPLKRRRAGSISHPFRSLLQAKKWIVIPRFSRNLAGFLTSFEMTTTGLSSEHFLGWRLNTHTRIIS